MCGNASDGSGSWSALVSDSLLPTATWRALLDECRSGVKLRSVGRDGTSKFSVAVQDWAH